MGDLLKQLWHQQLYQVFWWEKYVVFSIKLVATIINVLCVNKCNS